MKWAPYRGLGEKQKLGREQLLCVVLTFIILNHVNVLRVQEVNYQKGNCLKIAKKRDPALS